MQISVEIKDKEVRMNYKHPRTSRNVTVVAQHDGIMDRQLPEMPLAEVHDRVKRVFLPNLKKTLAFDFDREDEGPYLVV